ncbi:Serpentine receptor class alpha-11 [Caenorhabditis elegans]|uniref:Serpentine receptor class alpha-11 n=1 Tax=Caenorhabditis elegans TaxID=6239 RepID=SRA11_CAEEL|nr:Serpentine receptor class alpha-11 [Caenorhabditis elegans]Q20411.2 RecName: Full=Serpentine receptor class alpha-11; Short=Protein sra-11 [Caenorhabditis elegans]CAA85461.2 Serpentine receptor class alpha-11 [Caenorhabditis elegans]prf//2123261L chemosensory receptor [Caenorhabditis elegans]|eukprot:NP_496348.2 Serpentine receptor class alpha-11 [Caenorhabditis elegans]
MTTNNPVCASDAHMEMYSSKLYTSALFLNLIIATTSMILTGFAIQKLFMESIINISTRMFLFCGLMCCSLHQTAYIVLRIQVIYQVFFKLSEPCNLYYPAIDCKYVTFSLVAGNTGMIFIQSAMTIDRIFATIFPKLWPKLKYWPGVVLSILMIACNYANVQIIFWGDPLTEYVPTCGQFPSKSVNRFQTFLAIALYMSIAHMVINVIILYINVLQDRQQSKSFNVNQRYQSREALKSSQAIFFLSMSQFFACLIYSVFTKVFLEFQLNLSPLQSGLVLALSYTTPYACIAIPSLIIFTFRFIKNQRLRNINELRSQTETGDECMRKIAKIWEK